MVKVKKDVDLKEFERFGFYKNVNGQYVYIRKIEDRKILYCVYITKKNRYLMVETYNSVRIAGSLQDLIYNLIVNGLIEMEGEETNE